MLQSLREKAAPLLLVGILFGLLILMSAQVRLGGTSVLEQALFRVSSPVARLFTGVFSAIGDTWDQYVNLVGARRENYELRRENEALRLEGSRFDAVLRENARLRQFLGLRDGVVHPSLVARIVANESLGAQRTLLVDRGSGDGVFLDMPALAPEGVIGRVVALTRSTAKIQLITDPYSSVAVTVVRTGLRGMAAGRGGDLLWLKHIPLLEDVRPGDRLVTSGLDRVHAPGYPVGTVLQVHVGIGPMTQIEVAPAADPARLSEVLLLRVPAGDSPGLAPDAAAGTD